LSGGPPVKHYPQENPVGPVVPQSDPFVEEKLDMTFSGIPSPQ
jgi:hypothetical protein